LTEHLLTSDDATVTEETVGQRIRRLRLSRGLSQRAISAPGVSYAYISRIENGGRRPSLKALRAIASRLGVDPEYLETGSAVPASKERELRLADAELELRMGHDLARAEDLLKGLIAEEVPDGLEIRIRATLGALMARRGDNQEAVHQLEAVVASGGVRPETRPDVYETLSRAYLGTNAHVMAIKLLEACIAAVDEDDRYLTAQIRYRSFLATALSAMGALERARAVLDEATDRAERLGGFGERVAVHWERARLLWMEGDGDAALSAIGYARALAEIADDTLQLARAHLFSAQIENYQGRPEESGPHLERAERLLEFGDDVIDRGVLRAEQAKREAKLGRGDRALELALESSELLAEHVRYGPNAWHALALAHVALGDIDAADTEYKRTVEALCEHGQWREAVYVAQDWAAALRAAGRGERAYSVLEQATTYSQRMPGAREVEQSAVAGRA
jgi:transcriptional regulator with XRE-family HTH domain